MKLYKQIVFTVKNVNDAMIEKMKKWLTTQCVDFEFSANDNYDIGIERVNDFYRNFEPLVNIKNEEKDDEK